MNWCSGAREQGSVDVEILPVVLPEERASVSDDPRHRQIRDDAVDVHLVRHVGRRDAIGFGGEADSAEHLPHHYARLCAAYTGNHDNNTIVGWFRELPRAQKKLALERLGGDPATVHTNAIRAVLSSAANIVLFPMQDVLGLDERARMNVPGTAEGNWRWRLPATNLVPASHWLRRMVEAFGRETPNATGTKGWP